MAFFGARLKKSGFFERPSGTKIFPFYLVNGIFSLKILFSVGIFCDSLWHFLPRESGSTDLNEHVQLTRISVEAGRGGAAAGGWGSAVSAARH